MLKIMPNTKNSAIVKMHTQGAIITALLGGTDAMRQAGTTYLPKHPRESQEDYNARKNTAVLFPAFSETLSQMVGRVFFKPIDTHKVSGSLNGFLLNIDLQNNDINIFSSKWFADALAYGSSYVIVDFPTTNGTLADNRHARPYFVHVKNTDVLGFKHEFQNGVPVCTQFRYRQTLTVDDGEFGEKNIEQITVWDLGRVRHYRKDDKGKWQVSAEKSVHGANGKPLNFVPVVDLVLEPQAFFVGKIPLLELAHLNVKHWQMQSDYHNIVHFVSVPLLAHSGSDDLGDSQTVASNNLLQLGADGKLSYVEHSGAAIGAAVTALEELKDEMATAGAKLLTRTKLALTDSQARDEQGKEISKLRVYANRLEDALGRALDFAAQWQGETDGGTVEISGNIDADFDPSASFADVLKMQAAGVLSGETVFEEAQARSIISPQREWQDEKARLELQGSLNMDFGQPESESS
ncbi:DUF4055 domain-containing protein [Wielerella bovis]|uniref:DUF4055 domain-containing protein n=1 Tax=Wielerella bovis TaxID=2917790 RepID=UPI002019FF03|nr:DUF4055 domain-containing protein [Wielerella bovis]ULJ67489.1 DUF4055 domain-containing protein [Wielerella bovis]